MILLGVLVFALILLMLIHRTSSSGTPTVYGSMGCPHTVRQRENIGPHTFVDCTTEKCPDFVEAYPTTKYPDGNVVVGAK